MSFVAESAVGVLALMFLDRTVLQRDASPGTSGSHRLLPRRPADYVNDRCNVRTCDSVMQGPSIAITTVRHHRM
ncbi:hypothetical protein ACIQ9K_37250 [Streptomyces microflavus]|uniref:hypothetical protein n=1 Tax=Streptomyces microflavus TaxID=1919 RepID=UPI003808133F